MLSRRHFALAGLGAAATAILAACAQPTPTAAPAKTTEAPKPAAPDPATAAPAKPTEVPAAAAKPTESAKPAAAAPAASAAGKTKIVLWSGHGGQTEKAQAEIVKKFNATYDKIDVEAQFQGEYGDIATKMVAAIAARQVPDIFQIHEAGWMPFWLNKQLEPLDKFVADEKIDVADWQDAPYKEGVQYGKLWWLSASRSTALFYYNKDAWAEAGLPNRAPKSWQELVEWGPKLTKKSGNDVIQVAYVAKPGAWEFQTNLWQWGGRYSDDQNNIKITVTESPAVQAAQFQGDLVHKHKIARQDVGVSNGDRQAFIGGKAASIVQSTSQLVSVQSTAKFKVGVGFLPEGPAGHGVTTGGSGMAIPALVAGDRKPMAFQWLKFATDTPQTVFWTAQTGYMPLRKSAEKTPEMQKLFEEQPNFRAAIDQLPRARFQEYGRRGLAKGDTIISKGLGRVLVENAPADGVLKEMADELDREARALRELIKAAASY